MSIVKKERIVSIALTDEAFRKIVEDTMKRFNETGDTISKSAIVREIVEKHYGLNGYGSISNNPTNNPTNDTKNDNNDIEPDNKPVKPDGQWDGESDGKPSKGMFDGLDW